MDIKKHIKNPGFIIYYIFLLTGAFILFVNEKGNVLLWINRYHNDFLDILFKYWTHLGDGAIFAVLIVLMLMVNYYRSLIVALAVISQIVIIQGSKRFIFSDVNRPKLFLDNFYELHQVEGVNIHVYHSFPSGHTATAFTVAVLLSLFLRNKYLTSIFMVMALFVGISRVYLLQHFFIDIYFGSILGFLIGIIVFAWMDTSTIRRNPAWNRGIFN